MEWIRGSMAIGLWIVDVVVWWFMLHFSNSIGH